MPIDDTLARYSDLSFEAAFAVYLLALVLFVAEFAAVRTRRTDPTLVPAAAVPPAAPGPGRVITPTGRELSDRLGRMGISVLVVAWILHVGSMVLRGLATARFPWGNMYEFVTVTCAIGVLAGLIVLRRPALRVVWMFALLPVLVLLFVAGTVLYADAAPVVPALQSFWLPIHVSVVSVSSGVFLVSGVASMLFLLALRAEHRPGSRLATMTARLPDARALDRLAYRTTIFAFPLFGAGVILGAIWAEAAWGRFWGWDPKETVSFIAWVIYAAYLHARATAGWRETRAAWINIAGFVAMLFNLFVINMVVSGLHSYAGLN
ncbi:c-type cytochrome biogenesis protein CcsB [Rhodococcus ruber]|uniref:Cytochrome c assembly protein n=3 Tax=Nocardiaceae TaxID=85025 RepID=A0A098BPC6_9NOCA|nr:MULTISPECIES: c-type cytochrome biogenesis protein CcsB [Rhodococcus]AUM19252.1 c-type cytochrome biogenesis protein CcsB [Rhodococcus ruber]AUM19303.1 c-type cytochrome biogenesis protein CcsB [Rhodococcus ruber]MBP2214297.1 cytochrome c-type biogenesis protein CcsB [Rhodococcus ruber]MCD2130089.1 c-type cytochrome biogenesis protein CcsB [Rhodococcus ruber]MCF8784578.1 c-type cytochrome biogenesis protein CcsB [Rhodococcus ruber]